MTPHDEQKLERLIHRTLREVPPRRAPRSLEQRVLAELERRAALPWWKQNFAHWPTGVRFAFLAASVALVATLMWGLGHLNPAPVQDAVAAKFAWFDTTATVWRALTDFVGVTIRSIPPLWLYGGLATVACLYAALFGLGAAAYRTLYASR